MIVSFGDPTESHGQTTHDSDVIEVRRRRCSRVRVIPTVDFASDVWTTLENRTLSTLEK